MEDLADWVAMVGWVEKAGWEVTVGWVGLEGWEVGSPPGLERSAGLKRNSSHFLVAAGRAASVMGCSRTRRARAQAQIR